MDLVVRTHIFFDRLVFRRKWLEALLSAEIMKHVFLFHSEARDGEWHESQDLGTMNGGLSLSSDDELDWCVRIPCSVMPVRTTRQVKFNVLPFMVKIQSLVLIICVWQWFC
jgi:hypothetical protein